MEKKRELRYKIKMVSVNFRIGYEIEHDRIIKFFKDFGYILKRTNMTAIRVEDEYIPTEEFVRCTQSGRFHLFIAFGQKYSGTELYPQVKIFLHYDIVKTIKGHIKHFPDRNECRNFREIYRIEKKLISENIGFLEEKDRNCTHMTMEISKLSKFRDIILGDYEKYEKGKYRKRFNSSQYAISIIEQEPYVHIVCVYAKIVNKEHILDKRKSDKELERIILLI